MIFYIQLYLKKMESIDYNNIHCEILPEDYPSFDLTFKLIVIGNPGKMKNI